MVDPSRVANICTDALSETYLQGCCRSLFLSGMSMDVRRHSKIRMEQILILVSISSGGAGTRICVCVCVWALLVSVRQQSDEDISDWNMKMSDLQRGWL